MGSGGFTFSSVRPMRNSLRAGARQRRSLAHRPRSLQSARIILTAATQLTNLSTQPRNPVGQSRPSDATDALAAPMPSRSAAITLRQDARVIEDKPPPARGVGEF